MSRQPRSTLLIVFALIVALALPSATVVAQDGHAIIAEGFNAPQGVLVDPDGNVWVIDSGLGGDTEIEMVDAVSGEATTAAYGETARVVKIAPDGTQTEVAILPSIFSGDEAVGGGRLALLDGELYATSSFWLSDGSDGADPTIPNLGSVVKIGEDGTVEEVASAWAVEKSRNPDESIYESHPYGLAASPDGYLWVADAGANTLLRIDPESPEPVLIAVFDAIPGVFPNPARGGEMLTDPVPTGIAFDEAGNAYVSLLSGAPFVPGSASVVKVTRSGGRLPYATGLTMLTDIRTGPDGELYAVQFAVFTDQGPTPNSGAIVKVGEGDTSEVVVDGLSFPTSIDFDADGNAYITINGVGAPGSGAVVMYSGVGAGETHLMASEAMIEEEATPEATEEMMEEEATPEATEEMMEEEATPEATEEMMEEEATPEATEEMMEEEATPEPTEEMMEEEATPEATEEMMEEEATPEPTEEMMEEAMADSPVVEAEDQVSDGSQVTVARVVAAQAGWMVIHADADGKPGPVLGQTAVAAGETENVIVMLDEPVDPDSPLWAMLHVDEGTQGVYEFPGADVPVMVGDAVVMVPFTVMGEMMEEEATPEATEEMMEEATPEATEEMMEEATPEATEEMMEEATPEATEEMMEEATPEATEEMMEEATPEATEEMMEEAPASLPNTGAALPSLPSVIAVVMAVVGMLAGGVTFRRRK